MEEEFLFHKFFSDCRYLRAYSCEDIARQSCAMVRRWRIFGDFLRPVFSASPVQHVSFQFRPASDIRSKASPLCGSMVDMQSATAEIRRGEMIKRKKEEATGQKYNVRICYAGGHYNSGNDLRTFRILGRNKTATTLCWLL